VSNYPGLPPRPPKRTLTRIAIACFIVGLVVSSIFILRLVRNLPAYPTPISNGTVRLEKVGLTVFASSPAPTTSCQAKDEHGADIPLQHPRGSEKWAAEDRTYYVVAHSTAKVPPQTVTVTCADTSDTRYYVGQRHTMGTFLAPALLAMGSFALFFIIGTALIITDTVKRKRANQQHQFRPPHVT
jgi:hypothetical protein